MMMMKRKFAQRIVISIPNAFCILMLRDRLFRRIMYNREHVLQPFLPDRPILSYNLRRRPHCNKSLITKTADLSNNDCIIRAIYKDSY